MLRYNTQQERLVLPEYGRNIQQMIDHCLTITDREERNHCARSIISAMSTLFPDMRETEASRHKLWDHLNIMSNFLLDIDWPCDVVTKDTFTEKIDKVPYPSSRIRMRHYGRSIEAMIAKGMTMEPGDERNRFIMLIANQMKKTLAAIDPDAATDARVFHDLAELSHGEFRFNPDEVHLHEYQIAIPVTGKKRRKK